VVVSLLPDYTPPALLEPYGDSDREGFSVGAIAVNPGAWQESDDGTPGGDGGEAPEPLVQDQRPNLTPAAPEPAVEVSSTSAVSSSQPAEPSKVDKPAAESAGSKQPGAPGGARMTLGTPSAGGKVGSRSGVRMLDGDARPVYPEAARQAGIEGQPLYRLRISAEGKVLEVTLVKSSGHKILDDAGLRWLASRRFKPARVGDSAVEAETPWAVKFFLY